MKAIFVTGGKQYYVSEGDTIYVEKLDAEVGSEVEFTEVLYVDGVAGTPVVDGAKVVCSVEKQGKQKKKNPTSLKHLRKGTNVRCAEKAISSKEKQLSDAQNGKMVVPIVTYLKNKTKHWESSSYIRIQNT